MALFILFFLYLNITSWLFGPATRTSWQCGSFRCSLECAPGAVEPADIKVESHQQSSTLFHALTLTGLSVAFFFLFLFFFLLTNNLGVVSRHSSSAKQSQAGWAVGTREASLQPVQARLPCRGVAEHLQNSAASASCDEEPEQLGPVLHPSNQPRSRTQTWLLSVLLTNCQ